MSANLQEISELSSNQVVAKQNGIDWSVLTVTFNDSKHRMSIVFENIKIILNICIKNDTILYLC
jgi:hypothetical protein